MPDEMQISDNNCTCTLYRHFLDVSVIVRVANVKFIFVVGFTVLIGYKLN